MYFMITHVHDFFSDFFGWWPRLEPQITNFRFYCRCRVSTTQSNLKKSWTCVIIKYIDLKKKIRATLALKKCYSHFIEILGSWCTFDYLNGGYPLTSKRFTTSWWIIHPHPSKHPKGPIIFPKHLKVHFWVK